MKVQFITLMCFNKRRFVDVKGFVQRSEVGIIKTASQRTNEIRSDEEMSCTFKIVAQYLPSSVIFLVYLRPIIDDQHVDGRRGPANRKAYSGSWLD